MSGVEALIMCGGALAGIALIYGGLRRATWTSYELEVDRWHHLGSLSTDQLLAREADLTERQRLGDDSQWPELIAIAAEKRQRGL